MEIAVLILALISAILGAVAVLVNHFFKKCFTRVEDKGLDSDFFASLRAAGMNDEIERIKKGRAFIKSLPYEDVYIDSYDALRLHARYYKNGDGKKVILLAHGYKSNGEHDFSCAFEPYKSQGFDFLLIDQRAHGKSEGEYICFGAKERFDICRWCDYLVERNGDSVKIILDGISMGSTTVMLAAGLPEISKNVCGVIADCGFTDAKSEIEYVAKTDYKLPPFPAVALLELACKKRAKFGFSEASTLDAVKNIKVPIIFVHGEADNYVPCDNSKKNYDACESEHKWLFTVQSAGHGLSYLVDTEGCTKALDTFFEVALSEEK